ncbi:shikimate dehydrogenase [bacterium]|nr:MAG: shikimate dehydrogenase [bacterium]
MDKISPAGIYGLLGYPVRHSFSPAMHNAAFKACAINAKYNLFETKPEELDYFLARLDQENILGLNVTIPYKEKILDFVRLDSASFYLRQIRAVNTIVNENGVWKGFNTDIPGFSKHLREGFNPLGKKVAILGAGGAARSVVYVLANSQAEEIAIFDIDKGKASNVTGMIKGLFPDLRIYVVDNIEGLGLKRKDLLVNTTPVGMKESDPCLLSPGMIHENLFVYDLIYNPPETKLLRLARENGCRISNGLGMLLYQGMLAFEIWAGQTAPKEVMQQALLKQLQAEK